MFSDDELLLQLHTEILGLNSDSCCYILALQIPLFDDCVATLSNNRCPVWFNLWKSHTTRKRCNILIKPKLSLLNILT